MEWRIVVTKIGKNSDSGQRTADGGQASGQRTEDGGQRVAFLLGFFQPRKVVCSDRKNNAMNAWLFFVDFGFYSYHNNTTMKTVIITGANGNLGVAVTNHFLDAGYKVIATVRNEEGRSELPQHGNLHVSVVNLSDESATSAFASDIISKHGKIDALLMLVGGFAMGNIKDTDASALRKQFALNFETAYFIARPIFEHMLDKRYGRLIFIGSRPALEASAGKHVVAYALSKSLLFKLAEFMNAEGKGKNVTATVVAPSTIDTPVNRKEMPDADADKWVKPEALAAVLEFIISGKGEPLREAVLKVYGEA
jgi:NAD(P)-dependent dehydrogenase (short-subunit alcohol dehydrogenase family)